ncbi:hypothetical protein PV325_013462, partial [Microctonus aethiopoides]
MIPRYFSKILLIRDGFKSQKFYHNFVNIAQAIKKESVGKHTNVQGWVRAMRKMKDNVFIDINDGSTSEHLQVILKKCDKPENLGYGCCVSITGEITLTPNGKNEVHADDICVIGSCDLDNGLRDIASSAIGEYMKSHGFINIHTPILTSNDCEGAGEVFIVKPESSVVMKEMKKENQSEDEAYFNAKTYLTVSGQLHLEAMA